METIEAHVNRYIVFVSPANEVAGWASDQGRANQILEVIQYISKWIDSSPL